MSECGVTAWVYTYGPLRKTACCLTSRGRSRIFCKHIPTMARGLELNVETRARILKLYDIGRSMQKITTRHKLALSTIQDRDW